MNNLYLNLHLLRPVAPSCLNRDDTNSVKTCDFGGTLRQRVSSQCLKKTARDFMGKNLDVEIGIRTKKVLDCVVDEIVKRNPEKYADETAVKTLRDIAKTVLVKAGVLPEQKEKTTKENKDKKAEATESKETKTEAAENKDTPPETEEKKDTMGFFSRAQLEAAAGWIEERLEDPEFPKKINDKSKKVQTEISREFLGVLKPFATIDQLMFGRMFAGNKNLDYDASVQVAHGISVNPVNIEYDFFSAVDDLDSNGAGHIGGSEFTSSLLYCYADINLRELYEEVTKYLDVRNADIRQAFMDAVNDVITAFVWSVPSGKQNAHAAYEPPFEIYISISDWTPISRASAFMNAVKDSDEGYQKAAANALANSLRALYDNIGQPNFHCNVITVPEPEKDPLCHMGTHVLLKDLNHPITEYLSTLV